MSEFIKILFLGDIVGRPGRLSVKYFLENITDYLGFRPDFIVANCENASHGFGLTEKNYSELISFGINVLTSGNHIWDKKEVYNYIDDSNNLLRPLNYPYGTPGKGSTVFEKNGYSIGVINLLGRIFMDPYESPWEIAKSEIMKLQMQTPIVIVDFHAEATAEKMALGYFLAYCGITAFIGTHTHVQTSDEQIISGCTAYITDVGFCGAHNSVIGMDIESSIKRLTSLLPSRYEIPQLDEVIVNGVVVSVDPETGVANDISRIRQGFNLKNLLEEDKLSS